MSPTESRAAITINRPIAEVFAFWHDVQNLPRFLEQLQSVRDLGGGRSRWRQIDQTGTEIEFDVELTAQEINERVAWRRTSRSSTSRTRRSSTRATRS
jgi:uncharacterized membrane protein